jgi:hypothetical protein
MGGGRRGVRWGGRGGREDGEEGKRGGGGLYRLEPVHVARPNPSGEGAGGVRMRARSSDVGHMCGRSSHIFRHVRVVDLVTNTIRRTAAHPDSSTNSRASWARLGATTRRANDKRSGEVIFCGAARAAFFWTRLPEVSRAQSSHSPLSPPASLVRDADGIIRLPAWILAVRDHTSALDARKLSRRPTHVNLGQNAGPVLLLRPPRLLQVDGDDE